MITIEAGPNMQIRHHKTAIRITQLAVVMLAVCSLTLTASAQSNDIPENPTAQTPGGLNIIQSLKVNNLPDGKHIIEVGLKNTPTVAPLNFSINTPPRIAFDFANTGNGLDKSTLEFGDGELRSANVVQVGTRTRLVINLSQMLAYTSIFEGNNLIITLQGHTTKTVLSAPVRFAEARPSVQKYSLNNIDFRRGKNGEGRIQVDLSDAGIGIDVRQQGKKLIVDFNKAGLPHNLQRKLDVVDFNTPVEGIDTFAQGDDVRMIIEPKGNWEHAAYQTDKRFVIEIKPVTEDPKKVAGGPKEYTGDKLTLNFQNISVREALNVIADFTNLNMVISDTVGGNLTLRLKDVPWDQALQIILDSRSLDMRKNGNVIQVAPQEEINAREKANLTVGQEIADLEVLRTESFRLSYQKADAVAALLQNEKQRILSKRGSAIADQRTNTVFVQDTSARLEDAAALIKQIDIAVRQVMIEARFVDARDTFTRNLGGKLGFTGPVQTSLIPSGFTSGTGGSNNISLPGGSSGVGGLNLTLLGAGGARILGMELSASEIDGDAKSIASPRVVTANGTEASVEAGVEIPYSTFSQAGTRIEFKKAVLSLKVTPQITPDNNINMKINANEDTVGDVFGGIPSVNTKQINTQVLVDNGGTVVIGGIYTQAQTDSTTKVPLLGDIPIIGWLFKQNAVTDNKRELLIFISPKILQDSLNLR
ncbi:MAG: type IV pilus secretin PilQ [Candidatus Nitrotoga sp.]